MLYFFLVTAILIMFIILIKMLKMIVYRKDEEDF